MANSSSGAQLERIVQNVRADPGPRLNYATFTAFISRPRFSASSSLPQSRATVFYLFSLRMWRWHNVLGGLDHGQYSWMARCQSGYFMENGAFVPNDWTKIILPRWFGRDPPMLLASSYLTGAFCVAANSALVPVAEWINHPSRASWLRMGLVLPPC